MMVAPQALSSFWQTGAAGFRDRFEGDVRWIIRASRDSNERRQMITFGESEPCFLVEGPRWGDAEFYAEWLLSGVKAEELRLRAFEDANFKKQMRTVCVGPAFLPRSVPERPGRAAIGADSLGPGRSHRHRASRGRRDRAARRAQPHPVRGGGWRGGGYRDHAAGIACRLRGADDSSATSASWRAFE